MMLGFILRVPPCRAEISVPGPWARVRAGAVAADPAGRAKSWGARARRPPGSHLGKSGWRPGHCAGPSSHWGGCWPSPAGSSAWFGRRGNAEARGQDASGSGSRGPRHQRASARLRGTRARGELSPSLRFRGEVPAPGRGRGEDTGHPLGGPSHPPNPPRPAQRLVGRAGPGSETRGWGRWSPSAAPSPGAGNRSAADAGRTGGPGRGNSAPAARLARAPSAPVRTWRAAAALQPAAPSRGPRSGGAGTLGRRRTERRLEEGTSGCRNASVCGKLLVGRALEDRAERRGDTLHPELPASRRTPQYPPSVPRRPFWKDSRARALANPPLNFLKQSGVVRLPGRGVSVQRTVRSLEHRDPPAAHSVPCHPRQHPPGPAPPQGEELRFA